MKLYVKIGTMPGNFVTILGRWRRVPTTNDYVSWREMTNGKTERGRITEVRDISGRPLYFITRM